MIGQRWCAAATLLVMGLTLSASSASAQSSQSPVDVLRVGTILTAEDPFVLEDGQVEIEAGKIRYLGPERALQKGARLVEAPKGVLTPGFVDPFTHLGLARVVLDKASNDMSENTEAVSPDIHSMDAIDPDVPAFARARDGGVTTVAVFPASKSPIAGRGVALKTRSGALDDLILIRDLGLVINLGERSRGFKGEKSAPSTRMGALAIIRRALHKAQAYGRKHSKALRKATEEKKKGQAELPPLPDPGQEFLLEALRGARPVWIRAWRRSDLEAALRLSKEFGLSPVLVGAAEAFRLGDRLAAEQIPVVHGAVRFDPARPELLGGRDDAPARLQAKGARVSLSTEEAIHVRNLPLLAAHAVHMGMKPEAALIAVTLEPARLLGLDQRLGSLRRGKDADLVLWDRSPLGWFSARPLRVWIDGREVRGLGQR